MARPAMHIPQHIIDALGTAPDVQLAKIAKCSTGKIFQLRRARNIPAYEVSQHKAAAKVQSAPNTMPTTWEAVAANTTEIAVKPVEVQVRIPEAVKRLFTEGKHTASGVLIPFEVFAAAAMEAMR